MINSDGKEAFRLHGKLGDVATTLKFLAEMEWEFPNLMAQLFGKGILICPQDIPNNVVGFVDP